MKFITNVLLFSAMLVGHVAFTQDVNQGMSGSWQIGIGLGEIPSGGSFKPSITFGYHFSEKIYTGIIYQFKDRISRDGSSFNAKSTGLDGLLDSSEEVAQRFLMQVRYTPFKNGPYISGGIVFNGRDTESMIFEHRNRIVAGNPYSGKIEIQQTRPAGWGIAAGIGYQYNFKNGLSAGFEWTPAWGQYPKPTYEFGGSAELSNPAKHELMNKMDEGFRSSVTNMYKVFHIGLAYRF